MLIYELENLLTVSLIEVHKKRPRILFKNTGLERQYEQLCVLLAAAQDQGDSTDAEKSGRGWLWDSCTTYTNDTHTR